MCIYIYSHRHIYIICTHNIFAFVQPSAKIAIWTIDQKSHMNAVKLIVCPDVSEIPMNYGFSTVLTIPVGSWTTSLGTIYFTYCRASVPDRALNPLWGSRRFHCHGLWILWMKMGEDG